MAGHVFYNVKKSTTIHGVIMPRESFPQVVFDVVRFRIEVIAFRCADNELFAERVDIDPRFRKSCPAASEIGQDHIASILSKIYFNSFVLVLYVVGRIHSS